MNRIARSTLGRLALAALALALAAAIWLGRREPEPIAAPAAAQHAARMLAAYAARTGEPMAHFGPVQRVDWPEGWEFRWAYQPCPEVGALRVFVRRSGRASYGETPDCAPGKGPAAHPRIV